MRPVTVEYALVVVDQEQGVFHDGRLQGLLGYTSFGGIIYWIPLFMFVLLFGLSMDYHVSILSRIRELRLRGMGTRDAVVGGIATSAGVVTSAAVIMVAVFSIFAALHLVELKILGIGLSAAVLIDTTVVRCILVPAARACYGLRPTSPCSNHARTHRRAAGPDRQLPGTQRTATQGRPRGGHRGRRSEWRIRRRPP